MPRPGPRPYDCVRRAWHSERHQPIRGLIIQQIFRLVHENHSAPTKKNREWLEKLPIVVLKAEEIMYSKANSEGEYSNSETLWNRVNDAVDTIIRKDENSECGELLPPCVEAALNLGCVPVRASRSQRHNNPRTYLRPSLNENAIAIGSTNNSMLHLQNENRVSVYPLYYGRGEVQESLNPNPVIVGVPIFSPAEGGCLHNLFPCTEDNNLGKETQRTIAEENLEKQSHMGFDLSLRLGPSSPDNGGQGKGKFHFSPIE